MDKRILKMTIFLALFVVEFIWALKVGFDGIYAIHPVSKILAVKNKTPDIFEKITGIFTTPSTVLKLGLYFNS